MKCSFVEKFKTKLMSIMSQFFPLDDLQFFEELFHIVMLASRDSYRIFS